MARVRVRTADLGEDQFKPRMRFKHTEVFQCDNGLTNTSNEEREDRHAAENENKERYQD